MKVKLYLLVAMIVALTCVFAACDIDQAVDGDAATTTNEIVGESMPMIDEALTGDEGTVTSTSKNDDDMVVGGEEAPYAADTVEQFLSDWASAQTDGVSHLEYAYKFLLCTPDSEGNYYVKTPVIVNDNYFLRGVYAMESHYKFYISPIDEIDEPQGFIDYTTSVSVMVRKSYGSFDGVVRQFGLNVENGVAVRETKYGYSEWYIDFQGRAVTISVPDALGVENLTQLNNYMILETYTLIDGELTQVD